MRFPAVLVLAVSVLAWFAPPARTAERDPVVGEWLVITTFRGDDLESTLRVERGEDGALSARYTDSGGKTTTVESLSFAGGVLSFVRTAGPRKIRFEAKVEGDRFTAHQSLGRQRIPARGARGEKAIAALRAERAAAAKANERGDDLEEDYKRNHRRAAPRDGFPVLFDPVLTPAAEAKDIRDDEPVIGIAIGGEAKAYPISIMGRHELANDTCGGEPIAASW